MRTDRTYRPGVLNVQVNGMQIEDLYNQHQAYKRKNEELLKQKGELLLTLKEQGRLIKDLKAEITRLKETT